MSLMSFTLIFVVLLIAQSLTRLYLSSRQMRYVNSHRGQVPSEFAEKISLHSHQRAADYTVARQKILMLEIVFDAIVLIVLTLMGGLNWINQELSELISADIWYQVALVLSVFMLTDIIGLPFTLYRTFVLEQKFGFNRMTPKLFILDSVKKLVLSLAIGVPILYALFALINWLYSPQWWLWAWIALCILSIVFMYAIHKFIMPLFNKFTPLENEEINERVNALAQRANFGLGGLYVMDSSKRSAHGNAFFTGFGKNRRIVFFDTLLNKLKPAEIEAVLAHELGHFKHKHIIKRIALTFIMSFIFFALLGYLINQPWFYGGLGVFLQPGRPMFGIALVLLLLVLPVFTFFITPISSFMSRKDEFEADRYAVEQTNSDDLISALVKLYNDNAATLTPDPVHSRFYDSHPPASVRIQHLHATQRIIHAG